MVRGCLAWLAAYLAAAWVIHAGVSNRIAEKGFAIAASAVIALIAVMAAAHIGHVVRAVRDLVLIRRAASGTPPDDGKRYAAIGPIEPAGGRVLSSPLTGMPAIAYSYEVISTAAKWHGVALTPAAVRTASGHIRILAMPDLAFRKNRLRGGAVAARAADYIRSTSFKGPNAAGAQMRDLFEHYRDSDGSVRADFGPPNPPTSLDGAAFVEQVVAPGDVVRAIGIYSASQRALVLDPKATAYSIRLEKADSGSPVARIASGMMNATLSAAIALLILAGIFAFAPLEGADPSALEITIENAVDERLRPHIASLQLVPFASPARSLALLEARGAFRTASGRTVVDRAVRDRTEHGNTASTIRLYSGGTVVGTIALDADETVTAIRFNGSDVDASAVRTSIVQRDAEWHGRVTWPEGHIVFRAATE